MSIEMSFDVAGLTEVKSRRPTRDGFKATYYLDGESRCVAKTCTMCRVLLPRDAFTADPRNIATGLMGRCRECGTIYKRESQAGTDVSAEAARRHRLRNRSRSREEVLLIRSRKHPHGVKRCRRCAIDKPLGDYYEDSNQYDGLRLHCIPCANAIRNRTRGRKVPSRWEEVGVPLECYICGGPFEEIEHIWATSTGGPDVPRNTLPSCAACNRGPGGKHTQMLFTYLWGRFGAREAGEILRRVTMDYGVWPFDQPYVAEDWEVSA